MSKQRIDLSAALIQEPKSSKGRISLESALIDTQKKNPIQNDLGTELSGAKASTDTRKDEDGFWGGLSDTFDLGIKRMAGSTIAGGATFLTKLVTGAIKGAVGADDIRGQKEIKPLIDILEAPSEWLSQKAAEYNTNTVPQLEKSAVAMGLKEDNLYRPANELLREDPTQGFLKIGIESVKQIPQLIATAAAGESKLAQFGASATLATSQAVQEEYEKDKNVSGIDVLQSGVKGVVEGLTEMIFDTDLKTLRKTGQAIVDVTMDGATDMIKNIIKSQGKKEAREAIIRTWGGVVKEGLKGAGQEAVEEGISNAAGFIVDTIDSGKLDKKDYDKALDDFYDSILIGGFMGGGVSSIGASVSKQKLTKEQERQISKLEDVVNDESMPTDAREIAKGKIDDIVKYNFGIANDNYKLVANLPIDQRVEALKLTNKIEDFEYAKSMAKTEDLIATFDLKIEDLENKRKAIFDEFDATGEKAAAEARKTKSEKDIEAASQYFESSDMLTSVNNALAPIQERLNNNKEIDENELDKSADELYAIADKVEKDETLTPEQKALINDPIFEQIQKLDGYEFATKTDFTEITQRQTTKSTREVGRVERQGAAQSVANSRWAGNPITVTSEDGTVTNTVAEVTKSGKIVLKPKVSFNKKTQIRDEQNRVSKNPIVVDTNFTEFVESKFDEDGNVSGVVLKDNRNNTKFEINNPDLALDIALKAKQDKLGTVSDAVFEQVVKDETVGMDITWTTKLAGRKAPVVAQTNQETAPVQQESPTKNLTPRQAVEVDSGFEQRTDSPLLNTLGAQVKNVVSNAYKALKSISPNSRMVIYDNEDSMIEGLVNEGVYRDKAIEVSMGAGGLFNPSTGNIHINKGAKDSSGNIINTLTGTTLPHEITHAVLLPLAKQNPKEFAKMVERILPFIPEPQRTRLQEFAGQYEGDGVDMQAEEFLSELGGMITRGDVKFTPSRLHKIRMAIKEFVQKVAKKLNNKELAKLADKLFPESSSAQEDMKFFSDLARSIQSGKKIDTSRLEKLKTGSEASQEVAGFRQQKITSVKNIDVKEVRTLSRAGNRVSKGLSVSTKNGKKVVQEAEDLSLEYVKTNAPDLFIANSNIIAKYPLVSGIVGDGKIETLDRAQEVYDVFSREVANNLEYLMDNFNQSYKDVSTLWYDGANILAQDLSKKYNVTTEQVAGIIASLSPQKDWYQNVRLAEMVLMAHEVNPAMSNEMVAKQKSIAQEGLKPSQKALKKAEVEYKKSRTKANKEKLDAAKEKYESNLNNSNKIIDALSKLIGQRMNSVPNEMKGYYTRLYHEVNTTKDYDILSPDGQVMGIAVKNDGEKAKVAWGSYTEINKANAIYLDGSQENITRSLGEMHKIRNFYNNIIDPMSKDQDVTMDTHAIAAALLMPLSGNSKQVAENFGTGTKNSSPLGIKGLYYAYAEGYKLAAKENDLLPRQVQSITWEAIRGLFPATFKNSKENVSAIENIWNNYATNKISIDEARNQIDEFAGGIKDPTWARPIQEGGTEDTQQGDVGRGVDGIGQGSVGESKRNGLKQQKIPNATKASKKAFEQKRKFDIKKFPTEVQKWLFDRQINIRRALKDADMEFSLYALVNKAGAAPLANYKFQNIYKDIYSDLTKEEVERLDDFIFLRRVIAIDANFDNQRNLINKKIRDLVELKKIAETKEELRNIDEEIKSLHERAKEKKRPDHPTHTDVNDKDITTNKESAEKTLADYKKSLGEEAYNKIYDKSNKYFSTFTDLLKYKYDNGLITKEEYDMYKDYNYSPRKFFEHMFGDTNANIYSNRGVSLNQDEIKGIEKGSLDYLETDSMKLLHSAMVATEHKVMTNKALKTFFEEGAGKNLSFFKELNYERRADGSIATNKDGSLKFKEASYGFTNMIFKVNGVNQGFQLQSDLANEFSDIEKWNTNHTAYKMLSKLSGAQVLRQLATGMNIGFFITNIPIDLLSQIHFNDVYNGAGVGVAGEYAKAISGTVSIAKSIAAKDKAASELALEYAQAGGLMMTQSQEGTSNKPILNTIEESLSYLGNLSELASKLNAYKSVKEREIAKYENENNGQSPDAAAMEKIKSRAAYEARGAMDFHRGGLLTKYLDGFIPYINVAFQGTRITAEYIKNNPVKFFNKITQAGLGVIALTLYNMMVAGDEWDNDDLQQAKAGKLLVFSPFKNSDGTHSYAEIPVPTGAKMILNLFQNMGEGMYYKHIAKTPEKLNGTLAKTLSEDLTMILPKFTTMMPPTAKAIYEYSANKNLWTNRDINYDVVRTKDEGRFDEKVLGFYKIMAKVADNVGLEVSPIRTQKAVEDMITNPHTNIAVGLAYTMMDKFINLVPQSLGGLSPKEQSKYAGQKIGDFAIQPVADLLGRATGTTDKKNNGKYVNIQEIVEQENKNVGSYRQEIKFDVQKMAEDKAPAKDVIKYLTSLPDVGDKKFASSYYKSLTENSYLAIPSNKYRYGAIAFGATTDEARAKVLYATFPNMNVLQNEQVMKDLKIMGIANPMTIMYYKKIYENKGVLKER